MGWDRQNRQPKMPQSLLSTFGSCWAGKLGLSKGAGSRGRWVALTWLQAHATDLCFAELSFVIVSPSFLIR